MQFTEEELHKYMSRCLELARKSPDTVIRPWVGSLVLSKDKLIVGEGYRDFIGKTNYMIHAERMALDQAAEGARGGALFTTLEPCVKIRNSQVFKSCTELIVERGIQTLVMALKDKTLNGDGLRYMINRGVNIIEYKGLNGQIVEVTMLKPNCSVEMLFNHA